VFSALLSAAMAARLPEEDFKRRIAKADEAAPDDMSPAVVQARWQTLRVRDWGRLNEARNKLRWAWRRFFDQVDFLITPVMPVTAFPHDHSPEGSRTIDVDGQSVPYFNQTFWAGLAGVAYLPATVFPAGLASDGLPVGLQIIGPAFGDLRTIQLAQRLEQLGFAFVPPQGYD
jgi:amidase